MTGKEAEQTLSVIRTLMERSTRYTNLSGHAVIASLLWAVINSIIRSVSCSAPINRTLGLETRKRLQISARKTSVVCLGAENSMVVPWDGNLSPIVPRERVRSGKTFVNSDGASPILMFEEQF